MKRILLIVSILSITFVSLFLTSCNSLEEFRFDSNYLTLNLGETKKATSIEDTNNEVNYFSGNDSVASVYNDGNVTGVSVGETTIYALFNNEHYEYFVKVISGDSAKELEIYQKDLVLTGTYDEAKYRPAIPIKATYYGHNTQIEL